MMLPNPYVEVDKETVEFPVLSDEIKIADWALFYQKVYNLETQSEVTDDAIPYLHHLKGQTFIDWNSYAGSCPTDEKTMDNYSADIDHCIKFHESRADEDLLMLRRLTWHISSS